MGKYKKLEEFGIFNAINGLLFGKPQDEVYYDEYKEILLEEIGNKDLSILNNLNVGYDTPRCIIPFGVNCKVDVRKQTIIFDEI